MEEVYLKKLGIVKEKIAKKDFDGVYDYYKQKAEKQGDWGNLRFIREKSRIFIYVEHVYD